LDVVVTNKLARLRSQEDEWLLLQYISSLFPFVVYDMTIAKNPFHRCLWIAILNLELLVSIAWVIVCFESFDIHINSHLMLSSHVFALIAFSVSILFYFCLRQFVRIFIVMLLWDNVA
jgi:hypothetical protein